VHIRLLRSAKRFAEEGARYWIVRPEISETGISELGTVVSGPYIAATPGHGKPQEEFDGAMDPPIVQGDGLKIILHSDRLEHFQVNSPVYYRGFQVGVIQDVRLSGDATQVNATAYIWQRYRALVRVDSQFWSVSGADVKGGVLGGLELKVASLRSLIAGGVSFASPDDDKHHPTGKPAEDGRFFILHADSKDDWKAWSPSIPINPAPEGAQGGKSEPTSDRKAPKQVPSVKNEGT
jgi:paraquat-inducible protein B